jgi:hypothetical protein
LTPARPPRADANLSQRGVWPADGMAVDSWCLRDVPAVEAWVDTV